MFWGLFFLLVDCGGFGSGVFFLFVWFGFFNHLYTVLIRQHSVKTGESATSNVYVLHENVLVQGTENMQNGIDHSQTEVECSLWTRKAFHESENSEPKNLAVKKYFVNSDNKR